MQEYDKPAITWPAGQINIKHMIQLFSPNLPILPNSFMSSVGLFVIKWILTHNTVVWWTCNIRLDTQWHIWHILNSDRGWCGHKNRRTSLIMVDRTIWMNPIYFNKAGLKVLLKLPGYPSAVLKISSPSDYKGPPLPP